MYINFWYPVCTSEELQAEQPAQAQIMGLRFVAFRDGDGRPHVLSDTCVHRGGSLSKGKIVGDCVACPYHGWQFGGDGACKLVPSLGEGTKPPARAKVDSYPVQEKYGIVFAFLGDLAEGERPPLYQIEEWDDPAWRASEVMILEPNCHYERSLENGMDPLHNEFVHPVQGAPSPTSGTLSYIDVPPWGSKFVGDFKEQAEKPDAEGLNDVGEGLDAWSEHYGPNTLITWIQFAGDKCLHQYFFEQPVDGGHTKIFFINLRNFYLESEHDENVCAANLRVTTEDISVLEGLYPVRAPETNTKEILMGGDEAVVMYRNRLKEWQGRGWRIDMKTLLANDGDVAYAIPSPTRNESGNWVLDPVPLMPAAARRADKIDSAA